MDVWVIEDADKSQWSDKKLFVFHVSQMSGKVWLRAEDLTRNQPAHFFNYDLKRNEITPRIEIRPSLLGHFYLYIPN